jgi:hypothetical protein
VVVALLASGVGLSTAIGCAGARSADASRAAGAAAQARVAVSPAGQDSTCLRGVPARPCASFDRAYALARGGDVVEVAAGAYGPQDIRPAGSKSRAVTIEAAPKAKVTVASMSIDASHVHLVNVAAAGSGDARGGLDVCDHPCRQGLVDVVVRNFHGKYAFIRASNVTVEGGEYGNFNACLPQNPEDGFRLWGGSGSAEPRNDRILGVTIHDVTSGSDDTCGGTPHAGYHVDCMQTQGGVNITIRDSVFYDCPTSDIQAEPFGGAVESHWLIENNVFGPTHCCNSIVLTQASPGGDCSSFVVRYNDLERPVNDVYCDGAPLQMYANIFTANVSSCDRNVAESYDVYVAGNTARCRGVGNRRCRPRFVAPDARPPNYRLLPSDRCARGAGDPQRFPPRDIAGHRRPQGARPDAGAYEIPVAKRPKAKKKH